MKKFDYDYDANGCIVLWAEHRDFLVETLEAALKTADKDTSENIRIILKPMHAEIAEEKEKREYYEANKPVKRFCTPCNGYTPHRPNEETDQLECWNCERGKMPTYLGKHWWEKRYSKELAEMEHV